MSFLGIKVPNEITRLLSEVEIPGEKVPRDHMHITMLYIGKQTPIEQLVRVILATFEVTSQCKPFTVRTSQVTSFSPNPDDGVPIIARIESDELHALHKALVECFQKNNIPFSNKYPDYKPHVTLGYSQDPLVDADKAADKEIPSVEWGVGEIILWGGDSGDDKLTVTFPLSLNMTKEAMYRAAVKLAKVAHNADGTCPATCPCHLDENAPPGHVVTALEGPGEEEETKTKHKGPPPRWNEWLDAEHQGGKQKVPNPNAETRSHFPQVAYSTALHDKDFFRKALKEYYEWIGKHKEKPEGSETEKKDEGGEAEKKDESAKPESRSKLHEALDVTSAEIDDTLKKYGKLFEDAIEEGRKRLSKFNYEHEHEKSAFAHREFAELSENEKLIHIIGHEIGEKFEKDLGYDERSVHDNFFEAWRNSSDSGGAMKMMGALRAMGVEGDDAPGDETKKHYRDEGADNEAMKRYAKKAYLFQQAFFKKLGVKELTLYRGVSGQGVSSEPPDDGSPVKIKTRVLSSFSTDPEVAKGFGRTIKFKVPVENVFGSNMVRPEIGSDVNEPPSWGEAELVVMGASNLEGELAYRYGRPPKKEAGKMAAAKKPIEIHFNQENENWLQNRRKKLHLHEDGDKDEKGKKHEKGKGEKKAMAVRVAARYLRGRAT